MSRSYLVKVTCHEGGHTRNTSAVGIFINPKMLELLEGRLIINIPLWLND